LNKTKEVTWVISLAEYLDVFFKKNVKFALEKENESKKKKKNHQMKNKIFNKSKCFLHPDIISTLTLAHAM